MMVTGRIQLFTEFLRTQANARGWPYLTAWGHRICGILLTVYLWFHILTLAGLHDPAQFETTMKTYGFALFVFLEWLLAVPVIYHSLNGGRLILYEIFGNRRDGIVLKWVFVLGGLYSFLLAVFMRIGSQEVSHIFFWLSTAVAAACLTYITVAKIRFSGASLLWKLQRISGAFLLLMVPAHLLFMHLNPITGHSAQMIVARMDSPFIKLIDFSLVVCALFHAAYGLCAIARDYLASSRAYKLLVVLVCGLTLVFFWIGVKLIVLI